MAVDDSDGPDDGDSPIGANGTVWAVRYVAFYSFLVILLTKYVCHFSLVFYLWTITDNNDSPDRANGTTVWALRYEFFLDSSRVFH